MGNSTTRGLRASAPPRTSPCDALCDHGRRCLRWRRGPDDRKRRLHADRGTVGTYKKDGTPDELPVLLVQEWDALHRNHPAFANALIDDWLRVFVHEAFHTRQLWQPRVARVAKEGLLPDALAAFYDANAPFRAAVQKERDLLAHAVDEPHLDAKSARHALSKWLALYDRRGATFHAAMDAATPGHDAWRMDGAETFVEGTARYVEAGFLMAPHEDLDAALASDPSYGRFASSRGKRASQLVGLSGGDSKYFYPIGMYVSFLMDAADPGWKKNVFDSDGLLVDAVRRTVSGSG